MIQLENVLKMWEFSGFILKLGTQIVDFELYLDFHLQSLRFLYMNWGFPIKYLWYPNKISDFPIKLFSFPIKLTNFPIKFTGFPIKLFDFPIKLTGFPIKPPF